MSSLEPVRLILLLHKCCPSLSIMKLHPLALCNITGPGSQKPLEYLPQCSWIFWDGWSKFRTFTSHSKFGRHLRSITLETLAEFLIVTKPLASNLAANRHAQIYIDISQAQRELPVRAKGKVNLFSIKREIILTFLYMIANRIFVFTFYSGLSNCHKTLGKSFTLWLLFMWNRQVYSILPNSQNRSSIYRGTI